MFKKRHSIKEIEDAEIQEPPANLPEANGIEWHYYNYFVEIGRAHV